MTLNFSDLPGNDALKRQLNAQGQRRGLSHAWIISGPPGSGRHTLANLLTAALICTDPHTRPCKQCVNCRKVFAGIHPDVIQIKPDGPKTTKEITVAQIRAVHTDAYIRPNEAQRKIYLFDPAQNMNPSAQNTMLKLLEDGPPYAAFLLLCENAGSLLPTVRSRCEVLYLTPANTSEGDITVTEAADTLLDCLSSRQESTLLEYLISLEKWDGEQFAALLDELVELIRDTLVCQTSQSPANSPRQKVIHKAAQSLPPTFLLHAAQTARKLRDACAFHVGTGHLCGWLCAELYGATLL